MKISDEVILKSLANSEQLIKQNYKIKPLPFQKGYRFIRGEFPILLSAPHAARTIRNGKIRIRENYVGSFVHNLSKFCNVYGIYTTNIILDPNRYDSSKYKKKIKKLIDESYIKLVVDIHGSHASHKFDVDIGTYDSRSLLGNKKFIKIFKSNFKKYGFNEISENFFTQVVNDTVTRFSYILGTPALQLEIPKSNRDLENEKDNTLRMFKALYEAIETIKEDFAGVNNNV